MYKAIRSGSHNGFRFTAGKLIPRAKEGDLEGCKSVVWIEDAEQVDSKPLDGTVKKIKDWLDDNEVEYPSNALKDELIEILKEA